MIMQNIVVSGDYLSCKIMQTNKHIYISVEDSMAVFINSNTISRSEFLYTDNENRYSVKIYFNNLKVSVLEIDKFLYDILIKTLSIQGLNE